jgi:hypothetical protein
MFRRASPGAAEPCSGGSFSLALSGKKGLVEAAGAISLLRVSRAHRIIDVNGRFRNLAAPATSLREANVPRF